MVKQVGIGAKEADFDIGARNDAFGFFMKEQYGRPFQVAMVEKVQLVE